MNDTPTHRCPAWHCPRDVPDERLMCPLHWRLVPGPLQRAVNNAYYDPAAGVGSQALRAAQQAAIRAVNRTINPEEGQGA